MKYLISYFLIISLACGCRQPVTFQSKSEPIPAPAPSESNPDIDLSEARVSIRKPEQSELLAILEDLNSQSAISETNYIKCRSQIQNNQLQKPLDLMSYALGSINICDTALSPPPAHYPEILNQIAKYYHINLTNCKSEFIERYDELEDKTVQDIMITAEVANKKYLNTLTFFDYQDGLIDPSFYKFLNDALAEQENNNRIYMIRGILQYDLKNERYTTPDPSCMVFISLSEEQALILRQWNDFLDISYENHRRYFSETELNQILQDFQDAGFPDRNGTPDSLRFRSRDEVLSLYSSISAYLHNELSYESIIRILEQKSGGAFQPGQLKIDQDGKVVKLSFTFKGSAYSTELLDFTKDIPGIIHFANQILNDKEVDGNFYLLDLDSPGYHYIFLTEEKVSFLNSYSLPEN